MTYKVKFLPVARQDIQIAAEWYSNQLPGLGLRFTRAIRSKVEIIRTNPLIYVKRYKLVHTAVVDIFPFMIHFEFFPEKHLVVITSVLHTSLDPKIWIKRS